MTITRAKTMGFCFGVKNTIKLAMELIRSSSGPIYSLGEIVHNETLVKEFSDRGLKVIRANDEVEKGRLLIRAHGVRPEIEEKFRNNGFDVIDGTCPIVKKNQIAAREAEFPIILFCKKDHDEAVGIAGYAEKPCYAVESESDIDSIEKGEYTAIVQTTFSYEKLSVYTKMLEEKGCILHFAGSGICHASIDRRAAVEALSKLVEMIVVVGDENSANSKALFCLASSLVPHAYMVSGPESVTKEMASFENVGITAGASVSESLVKRVEERLSALSIDV